MNKNFFGQDTRNGKHHYLPIFYLNGFINEDENVFYAFNKQFGKIKWFYPSGLFYEEGLNDLDFGEYGFFCWEDNFFRTKDDAYGKSFFDMKEKYDYDINSMPLQIKADIVEFVLGLYWRVPGRWQRILDLIEHDGLLTGDLQLYNKQTGIVYSDMDIPDILADIKSDVRNLKALMPIFYEENIRKHNWNNLNEKFRIYETYEPMLIGDIPYVPLMTENRRGKILDEFMIPLDRNHILIYSNKHPVFLENNLLYSFFLSIIDGASNRIVCSNRSYLEEKVNQAKIVAEKYNEMGLGSVKDLLLHPLLEFQSQFKSFAEFKRYYDRNDFKKMATPDIVKRITSKFSEE